LSTAPAGRWYKSLLSKTLKIALRYQNFEETWKSLQELSYPLLISKKNLLE
jgi:hypothetical protein